MEKLLFTLGIIFTILTFIGAGYVIASEGTINAGYAVIPSILSMICMNGYSWYKNKK